MEVDGRNLEEIVEILDAIDGLKLVKRCESGRNDDADRLRDILVAQELDGTEGDSEVDGFSGEKKSVWKLRNATRSAKRVRHSSM